LQITEFEKLMSIERQVLEKLRELAPEKQKTVLDFVDSLKRSELPKLRAAVCSGYGRT